MLRILLNKYNKISKSNFVLKYFSVKYNNYSIALIKRLTSFTNSRSVVLRFVGFTSAVVGVFGATNTGGLNFKMSPHYSEDELQENNLKAMIVAMMMHDNLDEDEIGILMNSIQFVYQSSNIRKAWCTVEIKNFMNCSEQYGNFQDERCCNFRKLLKSCLQSKKDAADLNPPKLNAEAPAWPYHSPGKYKPPNLRKLHLSKCPSSSQIDPGVIVSTKEEKVLDPCCDDDAIMGGGGKSTSACRPCGCNPEKIAKDDDVRDSEDTWQITPIFSSESDPSNKKPEVDYKEDARQTNRKHLGDANNALDYDSWSQLQENE